MKNNQFFSISGKSATCTANEMRRAGAKLWLSQHNVLTSKALTCCFLITLLLFGSITVSAQDPWILRTDKVDAKKYNGETVANGMLGLVSSAQPMKLSNTVLAGSYDIFGRGGVSNFLHGFDFLDTDVTIDGQSLTDSTVSNYSQQLDMRHSRFDGDCELAGKARIHYSFLSLRHLPYCGLMVVEVKALSNVRIDIANHHALPEGFKNFYPDFSKARLIHNPDAIIASMASSPTGRLQIAAASTMLFDGADNHPDLKHIEGDKQHSLGFSLSLQKGQTYRFAIVGATLSTAQVPDVLNEVKRLAIYCQMQGIDKLIARHNAEWDELWTSDIEIEGDKQAQQDVHSMIYHLYAFLREGSGQSLSPMGLSGLGFNGHVFWDADTWMFPALLLLQPKLARQMVDYRYARLDAARQNAYKYGYRGALFPWESADTGFEETPALFLTGTYEHHVSGCVALAAWQYYCVSHDREWLREKGYPLIEATAEFWLSRVEKADDGKYHIYNVVACDEWAMNVDDDAFTNAIARLNLQLATRAAQELGLQADKRWNEVAQDIVILQMPDGTTLEHATYDGGDIQLVDACMLAYPLKVVTDENQIKKDIKYYEHKVPAKLTPSMTQATLAVLYSRLGDADKSWYYFTDIYSQSKMPPFGVLSEFKGGGTTYFITGAGGALQAVLYGFGGMDIDYEKAELTRTNSVLPPKWKALRFTKMGPDGITVEKRR